MPSSGPNFLVAGAAKSGTTSLCHYLRQHDEIFVAREKESHFFLFEDNPPSFCGPGDVSEFSSLVISDRQRYLACFEHVGPRETAVGESSVYYLYQPRSIERALATNPEMKIILILRNPVTRAFSAFGHQRRDGWEPKESFRDAIAEEDRRVVDGWSYGWHYRRVGRYVEQLEQVLQLLPRAQLQVLLHDDLETDPAGSMREVFRFLEVRESFVPDTSLILNASGRPRIKSLNALLSRQNSLKDGLKRVIPYRTGLRVSQRLRHLNLQRDQAQAQELAAAADLFDPDLGRLGTLIGRDLSHWSMVSA